MNARSSSSTIKSVDKAWAALFGSNGSNALAMPRARRVGNGKSGPAVGVGTVELLGRRAQCGPGRGLVVISDVARRVQRGTSAEVHGVHGVAWERRHENGGHGNGAR